MSDVNKIIKTINKAEPEFGKLFAKRILEINPPIFVKNFAMFRNGFGGVSLRSGIFIHDATLYYNPLLISFIVLHEIGHYLRYDKINQDIISLTNLSLPEFLNVVKTEEDFANNFALEEINKIFGQLKNPKQFKEELEDIMNKINELDSEMMATQTYHFMKSLPEEKRNDETLLKVLSGSIYENIMKKSENIIRQKIAETIKQLFEKAEIAPAPVKQPDVKPVVRPEIKPAKPEPRRLIKPKIHPGADPAPKAESKNSIKKKIELKEKEIQDKISETALKLYALNENPMQYSDDDIGEPAPGIKKNIEQRGNNPFSKIDILHKDAGNNQTGIEKLSDEEYKDVVDTAKKNNVHNLGITQQMELFSKAIEAQKKYQNNLEMLAKNTVMHYFGIPEEVMDNITVKLTDNANEVKLDAPQNAPAPNPENNNDEEDNDQNNDNENNNNDLENNKEFQELVQDFTPEEKEIIKQNVDKRTIANALMMGAGFRAHNLLDKIKPALDAISPDLYPFYVKIMSIGALQLWKVNPTDTGFEIDNKNMGLAAPQPGQNPNQNNIKLSFNDLKNMGIVGKSELILGDDKNGDGIREVEGARAIAMIFPVLLHEIVKACVEYIFASGLPKYTQRVNKEIMRQADDFKFEYWHKLLGPRLWKYLHDAIDYIVKERGNDYTIVAYLLQELSMLPPDKFLRFIELLIHDGTKGVVWLEKMLDRVEADLQNVDIEEEPIPQADFGNIQNLMGQIQNMLNQPGAEPKPEPVQQKPLDQMTTDELNQLMKDSINSGDFEKAAEIRDEFERRG